MATGAPLTAQVTNRCFVCGEGNPHGLRLRFTSDGEQAVKAVWRTEPRWEGFEGVIHGGIVSTVLDEAMSKSIVTLGVRALTCELRVRLRQHVDSGENLLIRGWVVEKRKRRILTEGSITDRTGSERAHAWATFLELPAAE